jgi:hypothetical protein
MPRSISAHDRLHRAADRAPFERRSAEREQLARQHPERQRLIIRAKAGMRSALEAAGMDRGHGIRADHDFINAFSVEVDDDDLASLAATPASNRCTSPTSNGSTRITKAASAWSTWCSAV